MAKNITYDHYKKIINNKEYNQSFKSLIKIFFITGLRINEVSKLIIKVKNNPEIESVEFYGKMGLKIQQVIFPELKDEIFKIKNKWANESSISKSIWRWNKEYGLAIEAHSLRRLSATLIDKNLDARHAQSLLNHSSSEVTEKYLLKINKFQKKLVAQKLLLEISDNGEEIKTFEYLKVENVLLKSEIKKLKEAINNEKI